MYCAVADVHSSSDQAYVVSVQEYVHIFFTYIQCIHFVTFNVRILLIVNINLAS